MKRLLMVTVLLPFLGHAQQPDWKGIEEIFGKKGVAQENMLKLTFPRSDLHVTIGDVIIEPGLALTSWIAFRPMGRHTMVMGDLVLLESEINTVEQKLFEKNLHCTAIHNHLINEEPKVMYMHIGGEGDPESLAVAIKSVLGETSTPLSAPTLSPKPTVNIDWSKVESVLARQGKHNGDLLQFSIPRTGQITEGEMNIPPFMGMATAINIQKVDDKRAAATGDFVLLADEVVPVSKTLTEHGITVTAIHGHMLFESPRLFFMHFWAVDNPEKIAKGLKAAIDKTASAK